MAAAVYAAGQVWVEEKGIQSAALEQCANGSFAKPAPCIGANWTRANTNSNSAHWSAGDSVPYRVRFGGLTVGVENTFTFEWVTTKGGVPAFDHITSYDVTESVSDRNNPCSGLVPECGKRWTHPIPLDPVIAVTQTPGVLTTWGAVITDVSPYEYSGSYFSDSTTRITITFIPTVPHPVLAWGGRIARRNSTDVARSPYQMSAVDLNGLALKEDLTTSQLGVDSIIRIIKQATPESGQVFGFSTTGVGLTNFTLVDDGVDNDGTPNSITFNNLLGAGQSGAFTVTETANGFYDLTNITCAVTGTGGSTTAANIPLSRVSITLQFGDTVTCTFFNSVVAAAHVSISGRAVTTSGLGIPRAVVSVLNVSTGETHTAVTNSFGYYSVEDLETGNLYMVSVAHKQYAFEPRTVTVNENLDGFDFIGN